MSDPLFSFVMIGPDILSPTNFQTQNFNKFFIIAVCFNQVTVYVFVNRGCVFSLVSNVESDVCIPERREDLVSV